MKNGTVILMVVMGKRAMLLAADPKTPPPVGVQPKPPSSPAELLQQANELLTQNKVAEALQIYDELAQRHRALPLGTGALYRKGLCLHAQGKSKEAVLCWKNLLGSAGLNDWKDDALIETARTHAFQLGQPDAGLSFYERLFREYPNSERITEANYQVAGIYYLKADYRKAKQYFESFLRSAPDGTLKDEARELLAKCEKALEATSSKLQLPTAPEIKMPAAPQVVQPAKAPRISEQLLAQADALLEKQDYEGARKLYQRVVNDSKLFPEYEPAMYRLALCVSYLGDPEKAVRLLEEFLQFKPASEFVDDALLQVGNLYLQHLDRPADAEAAYQRLLREHSASELVAAAKHGLGLACFRQQRWDEARAIFEAELEARGGKREDKPPTELDRLIEACERRRPLVPDHPPFNPKLAGLIGLGDTMFTAKKYKEAIRAYSKVVSASPASEEAAYALMQSGRCYNQLREYQTALRCYEAFLDKYKSSQWADDALIRAGVIYVGPFGQKQRGARLYQRILDLYPDSNEADQALLHLATLAYWDRNYSKALDLYQQLLDRYPRSRFAPFLEQIRIPAIEKTLGRKVTSAANAEQK